MDTAGVLTVAAVVVLVLVVGAVLRARSGRVRTAVRTAGDGGTAGWELAGVRPGAGDRALLLQLSSPVCVPCRQTADVLGRLADGEDGLRHVEVDVADRVDVARALGVLRTPTTVVFDRDGREVLRVSGVPRVDDLRAALPGSAPSE